MYVHINKINGKKYVGITGRDPYVRWGKNGIHYSGNICFWNAINKYGWDNFEHIIIKTGLTVTEASILEIMFISLWKTQYKTNGYNIKSGGFYDNSNLSNDINVKKNINVVKDNDMVVCLNTGEIFKSASVAAKNKNLHTTEILSVCYGGA